MFNKQVYTDRRARLHKSMDKGIVLILGNNEAPMNYPDNTYHYRQDSTFLYFFGIDHAGFAGVLDLDANKDIIFSNDVSMGDIIWMGPQPAVKDQAAEVGVTETKPFDSLFAYIKDAVTKGRKIHFTPPYRAENMMLIEELTGIRAKDAKAAASVELIYAIVALRNIKDKYEIAHLDEIMAIGYEMHTTAMRMAIDGAHEQQITGAVEAVALRNGGHVSFPIILSKRGETLHNHNHNNVLKTNDLLLVDCGFESPMRYATDNTRVSPVDGTFTTKQQEIYEIVLAANNNVNAQTKAGILYRDMHFVAAKTLAQGLKDLGIMKGNVDEAVAAGAHALFQPHGLGHMMGLDVHDMEDYGEDYVGYGKDMKRSTQFGLSGLRLARKLEVGNVFTNEPGCYFIPALIDKWKAEGINKDFINFDKLDSYRDFGGIRLEDDLIITEEGCRIMGDKRIPITIDEIANTVGK
ncbi:MAG: aminopeptidase P N-terminal domain-containing protein [Bacteroidales bacterium]|nr:aminopeptidase P N-terminal domain-containing protein [Bacteroidales bacterium]